MKDLVLRDFSLNFKYIEHRAWRARKMLIQTTVKKKMKQKSYKNDGRLKESWTRPLVRSQRVERVKK